MQVRCDDLTVHHLHFSLLIVVDRRGLIFRRLNRLLVEFRVRGLVLELARVHERLEDTGSRPLISQHGVVWRNEGGDWAIPTELEFDVV